MIQISFLNADGTCKEITAAAGTSLLRAAVEANVSGIDAECGGCCSCATCHVYLEEAQSSAVPPPKDDENALLDFVAAERRPNSRLSCQIALTEAITRLVVSVPITQV
jgi:2Fe-2S ferredoxin